VVPSSGSDDSKQNRNSFTRERSYNWWRPCLCP
jgi:hypothetical protein